ncbi:hypothetical protein NERG_02648 [Nematocida ausubeli]|uniref:Uncharacterized protein n=1 Tax=Nematocida ausubeli (strain ATCC PRA-371 / ERTm2) TaxID=1913371 RepID=H8ZGC7_NEMA1|nr:hypothetical protein NERG_02648 [Nematocida ausubeli]
MYTDTLRVCLSTPVHTLPLSGLRSPEHSSACSPARPLLLFSFFSLSLLLLSSLCLSSLFSLSSLFPNSSLFLFLFCFLDTFLPRPRALSARPALSRPAPGPVLHARCLYLCTLSVALPPGPLLFWAISLDYSGTPD